MDFEHSAKTKELMARVQAVMDECVYPGEETYYRQVDEGDSRWTVPAILDEMKAKAKAEGLWNLFLPESEYGGGLTNIEYAPLAEIMGRVMFGSEVFNCSAPDTGNMEVLVRYGSGEQKEQWLKPLLEGEIRSAFLMTEPDVASSDATNIECSIVRDGDDYVVNGTKWWSSGAMDPRCKVYIVMGKTDPDADKYHQQSMILVPADSPGVTVEAWLPVMGNDDAPHGHATVTLRDVRVPAGNMILGDGRGFEIAQGRLGPGRIHHCMRLVGVSERALERTCRRLKSRVAFGKPLADQGVWHERIANARMDIEMTRLLTLKAAYMMDTVGNKAARAEIAMIKVVAPNVAQRVVDQAIQAFGGAGMADAMFTRFWTSARSLRLADGPDEVHRQQIARLELRKQTPAGSG